MNVLLTYPLLSRKRAVVDENKQFWPPLGLAYLASTLESKGHTVRIVDRDLLLRKNGLDFDRVDAIMVDEIATFRPKIVGISVTTPNMPDVGHISKIVKERFSHIAVVLGGPHVTGESALTLREIPDADIIVRGEGERTLTELASEQPLRTVKGITYRSAGSVVSAPDQDLIDDIDLLPMPARHLLDMEFYTRPSRFASRNLILKTTSIFTARGCPYRCNFCAGPLVFCGKVRFHSPARVLAEIDELISRYHVEALYFAEDMFLSSKKRAEEILNAFLDRGVHRKIRWFAQAKVGIITEDLLRLMKSAGCVGVEYGFESGSQRVLDLMNKKQKVEESLRAVALTKKVGLRFQANLIAGYPGERVDDFKKTIDFIWTTRPDMIGFNAFMPLPGTPSYEELKARGAVLPRWEDIGDPQLSGVDYADMPPGLFRRLCLGARLRVILPLNLLNFIKGNKNDPLRLITVGVTQFGGVLVRALASLWIIFTFRVVEKEKTTDVLYLSYNGLLEPIVPSQVVPYLTRLASCGYRFHLLTFEKPGDLARAGAKGIEEKREGLKKAGISWRYLVYHKRPRFLSTVYDLIMGIFSSAGIAWSRRVKIVHTRGVTPGVIALAISFLFRAKLIFDTRGLLAEEYVGGGLWKEGSLAFRYVKAVERSLLLRSSAVTFLTQRHRDATKKLGYMSDRRIPMEVVPCCVDTAHFDYDSAKDEYLRREAGLEGKFVLMYPGKIGTFYLMAEMLDFFKVLLDARPDAVFFIITHDDTSAVLRLARQKGIPEASFRFAAGVRFEGMPLYLRIADAGIFFINPYKKHGSSPIKLGEFLATGVPVIINPGVGDTEELVMERNVGVVVRTFSPETYAVSAQELLALRREGEALRRRCREAAVASLSVDDGAMKYRKIYDTLAGRPNSTSGDRL